MTLAGIELRYLVNDINKRIDGYYLSNIYGITKRTNMLFWLRIGLALIGGASATFLFEGIEDTEEHRWSSIIFMIVLFIITCFIAKGMKINFPKSDRKKLVTTGIGSFIFMYLFAWIMTYTLLNLPRDDLSLPFT